MLVPAVAGLFSAVGLLFARPEFHEVRTCHLDVDAVDPAAVARALRRDGGRARGRRRGPPTVEWARTADLRYGGQTWEVEVELPGRRDRDRRARRAARRFEDEHERLYGVEARPARRSRSERCASRRSGRRGDALLPLDGAHARLGDSSRRIHVGGEAVDAPVRTRSSIGEPPEPGPLLVDEYDTTVVVRPGWSVRRDAATGTLVLERRRWPTSARVDPITLQIVGNALASIADEMATTIFRTAHSTVVRDGMDFSAVVCDAKGKDGRAGGQRAVPSRLGAGRDGDAARRSTGTGCGRATSSS